MFIHVMYSVQIEAILGTQQRPTRHKSCRVQETLCVNLRSNLVALERRFDTSLSLGRMGDWSGEGILALEKSQFRPELRYEYRYEYVPVYKIIQVYEVLCPFRPVFSP